MSFPRTSPGIIAYSTFPPPTRILVHIVWKDTHSLLFVISDITDKAGFFGKCIINLHKNLYQWAR